MFQLCHKLKRVKGVLKQFNREHFGGISSWASCAKAALDEVQVLLQTSPLDSHLLAEESRLAREYESVGRAEESFLRQKSRVQWLTLGDSNSSFFFRALKHHHGRSRIMSLQDEQGVRVDDPQAVRDLIIQYYEQLLGRPSVGEIDHELIGHALTRRLSLDQQHDLGWPVTDDEIRAVMFSLKDNKAPGPDGFSAGFFKKAWNVVGSAVTCAIQSFFTSGCLLKQVNATIIALIPKVPNPSMVKDFRPISCCNTVYKCISKILANRMKLVLSSLVSPVQTAFVSGRRISDNILLSQELLRNYHRDNGSPRCAMKVDLMKAYDSVRWDFLWEVLKVVGF